MRKRRKKIMNKTDVVAKVVEVLAEKDVKVTKKDMLTYVDTVFDVIADAVAAKETVSIAGFGKFETVERAARVGVNPQNPSVKIDIPASCVPKFRASSAFKSAVKSA